MDTVTLWEKIKRGLQDGATTVAAKAEYLGKLGRSRLEIARSRHAIHEAFAELGGLVFEDLSKDNAALEGMSSAIQKQVSQLKDLETALKEKEEAFEGVKAGEDGEAEETEEAS